MEHDDEVLIEPEDIEAYCVRCRQTVTAEHPQAVWTRKGMAATRGECPICSGTVFRMGKTEAHSQLMRPAAVTIAPDGNRPSTHRPKLAQETVYIACAPEDMNFAEQLADDLQKSGIPNWVHGSEGQDVQWAGGVHPALRECLRMVLIVSPHSTADAGVDAAWQFFREKRKPIVIAQVGPSAPPDPLRRSPRYDFADDYKAAFRQMLGALG
jgi:TIR domain/Domain of unknown function (DUF5679)